jgi:hypothetical protein
MGVLISIVFDRARAIDGRRTVEIHRYKAVTVSPLDKIQSNASSSIQYSLVPIHLSVMSRLPDLRKSVFETHLTRSLKWVRWH